MELRSFKEQKEYLKDLISHYEDLIRSKPRNQFVSNFLNFIKDEKFNTQRKLRNIRDKEIECLYFAKTFRGIN